MYYSNYQIVTVVCAGMFKYLNLKFIARREA